MRDVVDMPDKKLSQFILFTRQNQGKFPKARRELFKELSDEEITSLANIVIEQLLTVEEIKNVSVFL